jgi:hypothetical protein
MRSRLSLCLLILASLLLLHPTAEAQKSVPLKLKLEPQRETSPPGELFFL